MFINNKNKNFKEKVIFGKISKFRTSDTVSVRFFWAKACLATLLLFYDKNMIQKYSEKFDPKS